jgi:hypothetical protein
MTLTEAYEALMKMPVKNRLPDFKEAGRKEQKEVRAAGSAGETLGRIFPAPCHDVLTVITGDV